METKTKGLTVLVILVAMCALVASASAPPTPFMIYGYVSYENDTACNNPTVNINNTNTSNNWSTEIKTNASYNYYQLMLANGTDVNATEILQFNVTSSDGSQVNITEHEVTQENITDGGLFNFNISLEAIHDVYIKSDYTGAHNTGVRIDNATTDGIPLDQNLTIGETYFIKYKVHNNGTVDEETVNITVKISNATDWNKELANYTQDITSYHLGNITWEASGLAPGNYNITVNVTIIGFADAYPEDNERARQVTLVSPAAPTITNWYNNKTLNNSTALTINESECVFFNATADQPIDVWSWFVNGTNQSHNFDNFSYCGWTVNGTDYVKANATNANGTSDTINWTVTVNDITPPAKVTGLVNDTPTIFTVNLSWTANIEFDLVGYHVYQNSSLLGSVPKSLTYYNVTGLSPNTTYEFNVSAYDDNNLEGENATVTVTTTTAAYPAPAITDWYNNKTLNNSTALTINESECVFFNATADQPIDVWSWFVNGTNQSHNFDNFSYCGWTVNGTYYVEVNGTNINGTSDTINWTVTVNDITPPASVSNLYNITYAQTYINWTWEDPADPDFSHVMVYIDGDFKENVTKGMQYYNAPGFDLDTEHAISTRTVDTSGNVNQSRINHTARTAPDTTLPEVAGYAPTGTNVPVTTNITATFSEAVNESTLNNETIIVKNSTGIRVEGIITYDSDNFTATFDPLSNLEYSETYNVTITTGVQDIAGNNMSSNITWNFTTWKPDLVISGQWVNWPGNCTICYNITNIGNGTVLAGHNTTLYFDGNEPAHDEVPVNLAPNESYIGCFSWTFTPPQDNITVCADNNKTVTESNESNNCMSRTYRCGDVNEDGDITLWDVSLTWQDVHRTPTNGWAEDADCNGYVTMWDVGLLWHGVYGSPINCCCTETEG